MTLIFEVIDKSGRKIHLTKERWSHIKKKHTEVENYEMIEETIRKHDKITNIDIDEKVHYYYKYYKHRLPKEKFLQVVVKYLNGTGFVLTAQFKLHIK